ncbi:hypothetical protein ACFO3O_08065 [Dokdonia ponticola]|uniref:Uncharacterized protein n=1 Tax=Dokdonia ponticola TaxID=2041041 RepID=A0ABV9HX47_9FLAO
MIVDNSNNSVDNSTNHSFPRNRLLKKVVESIKSTPTSFKKALDKEDKSTFNEDELTMLFANQNQVHITKIGIPVRVGEQYRDIYHKTKGIPDLHYSMLEEGANHEPVFIMEAKRLPSPSASREKEYVIGKTPSGNPNGGIERFKLQKHGKGLKDCGILGYVEKDSFDDWLKRVNTWILDLMPEWSEQEKLKSITLGDKQIYIESIVIRQSSNLKLHHFWIDIS